MTKCNTCLLDDSIEGVVIGEDGECSFCKLHDSLEVQYPEDGGRLYDMVQEIRKRGKGHKYDVLIGISGGCDSSWILHMAHDWGLRILSFHFNNGWNTEIAESNMNNMIAKIGCTYIRYSPEMREYDRLCHAFLRASVSEVDIPNDIAMGRLMLDVAMKYDCPSIFNGHNFRTEGSCPIGYTYMDGKYVNSVYKACYGKDLINYPILDIKTQVKASLKGIKHYRPLYLMEYNKERVKNELSILYGWKDYGGHHLENEYTAFAGWLLKEKFAIDKRVVEQSAFIRSGITVKEYAIEELKKPIEVDWAIVEKVKDRLMISDWEWEGIMLDQRKTYHDYEHYNFKKYKWIVWLATKLGFLPETFYRKYAK